MSSIALTAISNKDIVERLFVFQGKFVNTHVGDPAGTGSADRVPTVDHTGIIVLGVPTNLSHIEAENNFNQYFSQSFRVNWYTLLPHMDKKRQPHACWEQWELFRAASPQAGAGTDASGTPPDNDDGDILMRNFVISIFIGPESDHWQCLSVTHSLTH